VLSAFRRLPALAGREPRLGGIAVGTHIRSLVLLAAWQPLHALDQTISLPSRLSCGRWVRPARIFSAANIDGPDAREARPSRGLLRPWRPLQCRTPHARCPRPPRVVSRRPIWQPDFPG